jgi:heptaprenyl diphosphate synthase
VAILVGDFLFARASSIAADVGGEVPRVLADAIARVVQGQVRELEHLYDARRPMAHYFSTVDDKTGALLEASARLGAVLGGGPPDQAEQLRAFGSSFGLAFQIADDLLDFESDAATLGKAVLADVMEGKPSLPLAIALKRLPPLREEMAALLKLDGSEDEVRLRVRTFAGRLSRTGALGAARRIAEKERDAALTALEHVPESPTRELLAYVARALLSRTR